MAQGGRRGQTSAEFLVVLAIGIAIITGIMLLASEQAGGLTSIKEQNDARNAVLDLSSAAKDVYSQGHGAKKDVYVTLPSSYQSSDSYVAGRAIKLRARGTDYAAEEDFQLYGSLPNTDGAHWITVSCEGDRVRIGTRMVSLSKNSIYVIMKRNSTAADSVVIESFTRDNVSVDVDITWNNPPVTMTTSSGSFSLDPGEDHTMHIGFSSDEEAIGYYNGEITFNVSDGVESDLLRLPITVRVLAVATAPPLYVNPGLWNESLAPGQTAMKQFTVCTNEFTLLSGVTFQPSLGLPGLWISHTSDLGPMAPGTCRDKVLRVEVPVGIEPGYFTGSVQVLGKEKSYARDTISLEFMVGGDPNDHVGPLITDVKHMPDKLFTGEPVKFIITASDRYRGNNTIRYCEYRTNETNWTVIDPLDGSYNTIIEKATVTHMGFPTRGEHNVSFRCTDSRDNTGPEVQTTVKVMTNFLFVITGSTPGGDESAWMTWMDSQTSDMGYSWDYEMATDTDVSGGLVDTSYYGAMIMADYQSPSGIGPALQAYVSKGGRVVMLGNAFNQGPRDIGHTGSPGGSGSSSSLYIVSNLHYVTSDYSNGQTVTIFSPASSSKAIKNYIGTKYGTADSTMADLMAGEYAGVLLWGPVAPDDLNVEGTAITKKVFDYSLLQSTIRPPW